MSTITTKDRRQGVGHRSRGDVFPRVALECGRLGWADAPSLGGRGVARLRDAGPTASVLIPGIDRSRPQPSDEALIAGMAVGDEGSAVAFVRRYQKRVYGLAIGMLGDPGIAEDVAQEALLRVWRHAPVYDARRASVTSWVLTITRRLTIDTIRKRRAVPTDPESLVARGLAKSGTSAEDVATFGHLGPELQTALAGLPVEQRRATLLAALYGRTASEISTSEAIPLGTAKTRIRAGLSKLRAVLRDAEKLS
jgi:RNA polymerase sigma factor (sigma-70 family)